MKNYRYNILEVCFFFSSRRRHTRLTCDWSSDVCSSDLASRKPGEHGDQGKEALPWWSFALFGGVATAWLLAPTLGVWLGLPADGESEAVATGASPGGLMATLLSWGISGILFLPGALAGG